MPHTVRTAPSEASLFPEPEPDPAVAAPPPSTSMKNPEPAATASVAAPSAPVIPQAVPHAAAAPAPVAARAEAPPWTIANANQVYNIDRWGEGYYSINEKGNVAISPQQAAGATIDITD